ncbi:AlpA family transcriptional regulator [uncultured Microbacterium sp.]|uniref:helix-turn-helix transcriptional regulator n=1 Tax=uncultured Microbacterium sp. TaxID=191216 RepID=UPI0025F95D4D|nr:helix-turn-helix domain-containing protein [uncultured Microbacterium sp.]
MVDTQRLDVARTRIIFASEVAERLGRSEAQLRWMIQKGTAPKSAMIAGRRCWRESDVEAFIDAAFKEAV